MVLLTCDRSHSLDLLTYMNLAVRPLWFFLPPALAMDLLSPWPAYAFLRAPLQAIQKLLGIFRCLELGTKYLKTTGK